MSHTFDPNVLKDRVALVTGGGNGICLGIAGVDRPDDAQAVGAIMRRIGYKARTLVVNDALVALVAGAGDRAGVVIVAGTGSIAYGKDASGHAARRTSARFRSSSGSTPANVRAAAALTKIRRSAPSAMQRPTGELSTRCARVWGGRGRVRTF